MDDGEDELVIDQTGPDFMLDQLENYMNLSVFSDLSVQCKEKLISSAHCAVLSAVSPFLKKLFAYHRGLAHTAGQPVTILLPEASFADVSRLLQLVYLGRVNFHSAVEKKSFAELLQMLCISEKILVRTECSQVAAAAVTEQEEDQVEEESDNIVAVADDEDEDDADMMCLEPQTEMTVEGEDDDEESEGSDGGEEVNWNSGPPSVTLHPASTPLQRAKLDLPPSVSITRNPRPVTATITPAGNFRQAKVDREDLDRRTREFLDAQNDPAPGQQRKCEKCRCPHCLNPSKAFSNQHIGLHICHYPECARQYKKTSHLRAHLRSHIGDQPYVCSWGNCGRRFTRSDELHRHFRIHTGEKNHRCPHCDKSFSRSDHLKKHIVSHVNNTIPLNQMDPLMAAAMGDENEYSN